MRQRLLISRRALIGAALALHAARRLKVVVTGGHPGDPECGCGGTIARYADLGHDVVVLYLNRGEGYCKGGEPGQCGPLRTAEAAKACQILKARAAFLKQTDGRAAVDNEHFEEFQRWFDAEQPDVVFTHWPIDTHRDHRAISTLVLDAWLRGGKKAALYYYEVPDDTMMFAASDGHPLELVGISGVIARKRAACYSHVSQSPEKWYRASSSEGFVRHWESKSGLLP